jgi:hypothetical protein
MTRRAAVRSAAVVLAALAAGSTLAGCGNVRTSGAGAAGGLSVSRSPVTSARPSVTAVPSPIVTQRGQVCVAQRRQPLWRGPQLAGGPAVDADPVGVTAIWLPGLNQRPCRWSAAVGGATVAGRLASDIAAAPRFLSGTFCPNDDGSAVDLYFRYADRRGLEDVTVGLRGCQVVRVPGGPDLRATPTLLRDIALLAPHHALRVVQGG